MYMSWINSTHLLVGQYNESQDPTSYATIERNVEALGKLPIHITRVPMPSNCPPIKLCSDQSIYPCCPSKPEEYVDCTGTCFPAYRIDKPSMTWLNNGECNNGTTFTFNLNCEEWYFDGHDCGKNVEAPQVGGYENGRCPNISSCSRIWRTYLNVLQLNDAVLLPVYSQDNSQEEKAKEIWRSFGYRVYFFKLKKCLICVGCGSA